MEYEISCVFDKLVIKEKRKQYPIDLKDRLFDFSVSVIRFLKTIQYSSENGVVKNQLAKSATSIGANYEEAEAAFSKEDFRYKMSICFREAKESNYWLRIIKETCDVDKEKANALIKESEEIKKIFGSIMKKIHFRNDLIKK